MFEPSIALGLVYTGLACLAFVAVGVALGRTLLWRLSLVLAVILACMGSINLKYGIDLVGGTSLLYQADLRDSDDPDRDLRQMIDVLKKRIDPDGVMNLVWQVEAGNRVQIQMPLADKKVLELRKAYSTALDQFSAKSLTKHEVIDALKRHQADTLVRGVESRRPLIAKLSEAHAALEAARLEHARLDPEKAREDLTFARAQKDYDEAVSALMATSLEGLTLERALELSNVPVKRRDAEGKQIMLDSPRAAEMARLKNSAPALVESIDIVAAAHEAYQKDKGPLDDPDDLKRLLKGAGILEFRIVVTRDEAPDADQLVQKLETSGPRSISISATQRWFVVDNPADFFNDKTGGWENAATDPALARSYVGGHGYIGSAYAGRFYVMLWNTPGDKAITGSESGWELADASTTTDNTGFPAVAFRLNAMGGSKMSALTGNNQDRQMAIVLDERVYSAPNIKARIHESGIITGRFNQTELNYLIRTLKAGSLKGKLSEQPIEERTFSPSMGEENRRKGLDAAVDASIAVAIFMMIYYFFSGGVAVSALFANVVIILGVLSMRQATFTLPGIAGIVLTIGMCVDANVLIFERIREELGAGRDMGAALRLGYEKAFSSIIDGNLTNLIICFILYYTSSSEIRGFAVTLGIGIVSTLFTALFMTRAIFDLHHRVAGRKPFKMLPMVVPAVHRMLSPNINWIAKRKLLFALSVAAVAGGLLMTFSRGVDQLDIEFRAGTEVVFDLKADSAMGRDEVVDRLRKISASSEGLRDLASATVVAVGEVKPDFAATSYSVVTTLADEKIVADAVRQAFAGALVVDPKIEFGAAKQDAVSGAPVFAIDRANLGAVIGRNDVAVEVPDFVGGVAMVLDDLHAGESAGVTLEQVQDRVRKMRLQPDQRHAQFRKTEVVGLERLEGDRFATVAVIVVDPQVGYYDDQGAPTRLASEEWSLVRSAMAREKSLSKVSNFTPTIARTLRDNAIVAVILGFLAIVVYIWFRFGSLRYGLAAILALIHDVAITMGLVALAGVLHGSAIGDLLMLTPMKINMAMIAALLTIIGYSLNDTIVLFDRIRENRGKLAMASVGTVNDSINQVISRTALTSFTTFLAVAFMYVFGGEGVHGFSFAMVVGVVVGTYSSVAIAAPLVLAMGGGFDDAGPNLASEDGQSGAPSQVPAQSEDPSVLSTS